MRSEVESIEEAVAWFLRYHDAAIWCVARDGAEHYAQCYPEAAAFFGGERDREALRRAGD